MNATLSVSLGFGLLLLCYAAVDTLLRGDLWNLTWQRLGIKNSHTISAIGITMCLALCFVWRYPTETSVALRLFGAGIACVLAWNAATRDIDPVLGDTAPVARLLVLPAALLTFFSPAFLLLTGLLLSCSLRFWLHHATFPMRLLQALIAGALAQGIATAIPPSMQALLSQPLGHESTLLTFLVIVQVSHYLITALAKMLLGPRPWSWVVDNQIHHLAASAYSWGWARFVPWPTWRAFIAAIKQVEKPLQFFALSLELLSPLALLHASAGWLFSLSAAGFHLGVCAVSGLFFWDWIAADLLLAWLIFESPKTLQSAAFGFIPFLLGCCVLGLFPLRHKLWKPMPLGWYDTPLTARIHWHVIGQSGAEYRVPNSFMCPHERLYGRVNGCFFAPHPVVTYHLGEVWKPELRDAIIKAGASMERLKEIRARFGIWPNSREYRDRHLQYLQAFFCALNLGAKKEILPRKLAWLKAPGDQLFYWGLTKPYRRQEPVKEVRLLFIEEYFDGQNLVRLSEREVARVAVPEQQPALCPTELTPKKLDDYLLGLAAGRLIELPGFKKKYTEVLTEL